MRFLWTGKRSTGCCLHAVLFTSLIATTMVVQAGQVSVFMSSATVGGERLQLHGSGSRFKSMFRVCDVALYARSAVNNERALYALPGAKRLHLVAVRDIRSNELVHLLVRAAIELTGDDQAPVRAADMARIASRLGSPLQVKRGDSIGFDFVPGHGTQLWFNGDPLGPPLADPALFQMLLGPWVGPQAADAALRHSLLGLDRRSAQPAAAAGR